MSGAVPIVQLDDVGLQRAAEVTPRLAILFDRMAKVVKQTVWMATDEGMADHGAHGIIESLTVPKQEVASPLALPQTPGVSQVHAQGGGDGWKGDWYEAVEERAPVGGQLLIEEMLHSFDVVDLKDLVAHPFEADVGLAELTSQPLSAVHGNLDSVWKPGLNPDAHKAVVLVIQIKVQVLAACVDVAEHGCTFGGDQTVGATSLQARPGTDGADRDSLLMLSTASKAFFASARRWQIGDWPTTFLS